MAKSKHGNKDNRRKVRIQVLTNKRDSYNGK